MFVSQVASGARLASPTCVCAPRWKTVRTSCARVLGEGGAERSSSASTSVQRSRRPSVSKRDPTRSDRLQRDDLLAAREQRLDERAADQALRAGYEDAQLPPATAGRIVTSSPSSTSVSSPSRKRMSSPPTYTFTKRRRSPSSAIRSRRPS